MDYNYVMDTYRAAEVARELGAPLPRVLRHASGMPGVVRARGRVEMERSAVDALRAEMGAIPRIEGLSRVETQVLVALSRHPRGLVSVRQVALAARVSPTAAGRAVRRLVSEGLVTRRGTRVFDGEVREREVIEVDWRSGRWHRLAPTLSRAELPAPMSRPPAKRLPARLANVFWTGDWRKVDVTRSPAYVARRILEEGRRSPEAIAFLGDLPHDAVETASKW